MSSRRMGFYALINDVPGISEKRQTGECEIPGGPSCSATTCCPPGYQCCSVGCCPVGSVCTGIEKCCTPGNAICGDECCSSEACCNGNCCASGSICERGECINEELKDKIIRFDIMDNNLNVLKNMCNGFRGKNTDTLTFRGRDKKERAQTRRDAGCKSGYCSSQIAKGLIPPEFNSCDEYPPASSLEGGKSTDAIERAINCVPKRENDHQGGKFGGLQSKLRSREIPFERGDKFVISIDCNKVLGDLAPRSKDMKGMMYEGLVDIGERNLEEKKLSVALKVRDGGEITMSGNETVDPGLVGLLDGNQKHSYLAAPFGDLDPGNYSMKIQIMNGSTFGGFVLDNEGFNFSTNDTGIGAGQSQEYTFSLEDWTPGMGLFLGTTNNRTRIRWNLDGTLGQPAPNATTNSSSFPTPTGTGGGQQESPNSAAQGTLRTQFILVIISVTTWFLVTTF